MKLCEHVVEIYREEIKRGNPIVNITNWGGMNVNFQNVLGDYEVSPPAKLFVIDKSLHDPLCKSYYCEKCRCFVQGPLTNRQYGWERREDLGNFASIQEVERLKNEQKPGWVMREDLGRATPIQKDIIATPENCEIKDELWENWHEVSIKFYAMVPTIIGFEDKYEMRWLFDDDPPNSLDDKWWKKLFKRKK